MVNFWGFFKNSALELKNIRNLSVCAMLTATCLVLGLFNVPISNIVQLSFGFIAIGLIGLWYGPIPAALCAGISDLIGFVIFPSGMFFPGFTLSAIVGGLLYGLVLYRRPIKFLRTLLAFCLVGIIVNVILNTIWVAILYGYGIWALLPVRFAKNLITIPLNSFIFYLIAKPLNRYVGKEKHSNNN